MRWNEKLAIVFAVFAVALFPFDAAEHASRWSMAALGICSSTAVIVYVWCMSSYRQRSER